MSPRDVLAIHAAFSVDHKEAIALAEQHGFSSETDTISVATGLSILPENALGRSTYDAIVSSGPAGHHSIPLLSKLLISLRPGGSIVLHEGGQNASSEALIKNLLLCGCPGATALTAAAGVVVVSGAKPKWEVGAKAAISLHSKIKADSAPRRNMWSVQPDEDDELVDDDALLTDADWEKPVMKSDDCEIVSSGRKACKNCTCGRAEGAMPEVKLTKEMLENPKTGGCGSCALGDAFRCASCPYRGLPSFEEGKPIQLSADFLAVDV